jgi:hypothetical protein
MLLQMGSKLKHGATAAKVKNPYTFPETKKSYLEKPGIGVESCREGLAETRRAKSLARVEPGYCEWKWLIQI